MLDPKALDAAFGRLTATLIAALAKGGSRPANDSRRRHVSRSG
jgi:hypothetical protein